ncbi:hypothetical protein BV898_08359 [Hypsibius exemplaris]|uniref:Ig-like domain-containing protein n=1 Tax=Hypsibius exemplaris TaxID=2072580 RepID=A0A1W0WQX5_HYPEX|nr:hypothetical protein BV898_08359 [Hypsibius exemplaris]
MSPTFSSIFPVYRLIILSSLIILFFAILSAQGNGADDTAVNVILGATATIACGGYDKVRLNSTGNISDVYSMRFFKNTRSTDYILFTYLDLPPHTIKMPQNEWKERNISFSIQDQPQIRLPNVTFRDDAMYICDLTPASKNQPIISETRVHVVACPETVEVSIINTSADLPASAGNITTTTPASMYPLTPGTPSFLRGTRIQVRCTTVSYPEASLTLSIPGLNLAQPEWQNLTTESAGDRGYTRRTLDGSFTLDASDLKLLKGALTVDCRSSVANGTCTNTNSLALQVLVPQTKSLAVKGAGAGSVDGSPIPAQSLTGAQITGIVIGCLAGVAVIGAVIYFAVRHSNKDLSCKKPQGYSVTGMGVNGRLQQHPQHPQQPHQRRDISHPKAITAYPQHPCPKTGSVTFVDASALL